MRLVTGRYLSVVNGVWGEKREMNCAEQLDVILQSKHPTSDTGVCVWGEGVSPLHQSIFFPSRHSIGTHQRVGSG